jgi:hypothetical protein
MAWCSVKAQGLLHLYLYIYLILLDTNKGVNIEIHAEKLNVFSYLIARKQDEVIV